MSLPAPRGSFAWRMHLDTTMLRKSLQIEDRIRELLQLSPKRPLLGRYIVVPDEVMLRAHGLYTAATRLRLRDPKWAFQEGEFLSWGGKVILPESIRDRAPRFQPGSDQV